MSGYPAENCLNLYIETAPIAAGTSVAPAVMTQGYALTGIFVPASWTAANIGYEASFDNTNFFTVYGNAGTLEQTLVQSSCFIAIPTSDTIWAPFLRIKSVDGSNSPVNQVTAMALTLVFRRFLGGAA